MASSSSSPASPVAASNSISSANAGGYGSGSNAVARAYVDVVRAASRLTAEHGAEMREEVLRVLHHHRTSSSSTAMTGSKGQPGGQQHGKGGGVVSRAEDVSLVSDLQALVRTRDGQARSGACASALAGSAAA